MTSEWRRNRDKAGILLGLVYDAGNTSEAWEIYKQWAGARISFGEAKRRLERLAATARDHNPNDS